MSQDVLERIFTNHAAFAVPTAAVATNPMYYCFGGSALPAATVIHLLLQELSAAPVDATANVLADAVMEAPEDATEVVEPDVESGVDVVEVEVEPDVEPDVELVQDVLLPYSNKLPQLLLKLNAEGYYANLTHVEGAPNHPMIEMYDGLLREDDLYNYWAVRFTLQGGVQSGSENLAPSGKYGQGSDTRFQGQDYDGRPIVVHACITIGERKPTLNQLQALGNGRLCKGPLIVGYLGRTSENEDPIYIHILPTLHVASLAANLPEVKAYSRLKEAARQATTLAFQKKLRDEEKAPVDGSTANELNEMRQMMAEFRGIMAAMKGGSQ